MLATTLGLISDTPYPDRLFELPPILPEIFSGVDLILHAGDVGDVGVLDELSRIAPVVAVHGNDEPAHVKEWLPYQQIINVRGLRLLLCHSHYPDPVVERANRPGPWGPKLERIANMGRAVGAGLVVYGHTHVPLLTRLDDVVLFNPGALASGSFYTRQAVSSVGRLRVNADGTCALTHLDVSTGAVIEPPAAKLDEEFGLLAQPYQTSLIGPDLEPVMGALRHITYEDVRAVVRAFVPLYRRWLAGEPMHRADMATAIAAAVDITDHDRAQVLAALRL